MSLFGAFTAQDHENWVPPEFPNLSGERELVVDTETTGLRWFSGDLPIGSSISTRSGKSWYFPWGHAGGNLDPDKCREYLRDTFRGKRLTFFNAKFDINQFHAWGLDIEALGCEVTDVGHYAALLNDHRLRSSLEVLAMEELGEGKLAGLDKTQMASYHAADVTEYAQRDVYLTNKLIDKYWPRLDTEDLQRVRSLEDECIYATCEMERSGAILDEEKLDRWLVQSEREYVQCLWDIRDATGLTFNPSSTPDLVWVFNRLGIPLPTSEDPSKSKFGKICFEKRYLAKYKDPRVKLIRHARRLASLRNKYLIPYKEDLKRNGVLRYALHQLRADKEGGDAGTIGGRYSSSEYSTGDGVNIQQVAGKKYEFSVGEEGENWPYHVRELYIPGPGMEYLATDADQVEYRWFAHFGQPPDVLRAYEADPKTNFHKAVQALIEERRPITYELTKDCNFAGLFGAGLDKFAFMLDMSVMAARPIYAAYHKSLPEAKTLHRRAMSVAERKGFVRTFLGRRSRFPDKRFLNPAISRIIQGSAADENKTKLVALRKAKLPIKLRFTVHDEAVMDVPNREVARQVSEIMNSQILKSVNDRGEEVSVRVPLLWTTKVGPNWRECKKAA